MENPASLLSTRVRQVQSSAVRDLLRYSKIPGMISLAGGIPAPDLFDFQGLEAAAIQAVRTAKNEVYQYGLTEGETITREALSKLMAARGVTTNPGRVLITSGSQQALDVVAKTFLEEGDAVLVEEPTYLAALQVFNLAGAKFIAIPTHGGKIDFERLASILNTRTVKLIYLIPNFSNPTGKTLQLQEREQILRLAIRHNALIVEDDPYGALRYSGKQLPSLYQLAKRLSDGGDRVVYISSFSKILAPGLRLGWCIPPENYANQLALTKQSLDLHTSTLSQYIAAFYLQSGRLEPRLELLRDEYRTRRDALVDAIRKHLPNEIEFNIPEGGMFLWGRLKNGLDAKILLRYALDEKVMFVPGEYFFCGHPDPSALRLAFSTITPQTADEALRRLAAAYRRSGPATL